MKNEKTSVSRIITVPGQADVERKTTVSRKLAESAQEMVELCGGDIAVALEYFNEGRWAELRTKVSNALAGKSNEQKAVEKMIAAFRSINPAITEEQARTMVLSMPNMEAAAQVATEVLPAEIDETYFDTKKAEKEAAKAEQKASGPRK